MKTASASAPGKLVLMGDHAVVYGQPSIVTATNQRMIVTITESPSDGVIFDVGESDTKFLEASVVVAKELWGDISHIRVQTQSQFSQKLGLGSSAAVTVAFLYALSTFLEKPLPKAKLFQAAYKVILSVQGVGSGVDVAASLYGGTLLYKMPGKEIFPLDAKSLPIIIGYTGVKADTTTIVKEVKKKYEEQKSIIERIFVAIGQLVSQAVVTVQEKDWQRFGVLVNFNQEYLRDLGVSTEKLESLILAAKTAGAFGAKLSGAGGGDCMIAIVDPKKRKKVEDAILHAGGEALSIATHAEGVRVEA